MWGHPIPIHSYLGEVRAVANIPVYTPDVNTEVSVAIRRGYVLCEYKPIFSLHGVRLTLQVM